MNTLHTTPGLIIRHDASEECLFVEWQGKHNASEKRACCLLIAQFVRSTQSPKALVDGSQDKDTWADAVNWMGHEYQDILADSGLEALALVLPRDLRAHTDVDRVLQLVHAPAVGTGPAFVTDTFWDVESAHAWLSQSTFKKP